MRFILPLVLFFIVLFYETREHILTKGEDVFDVNFTSEVLFFGIIGPSCVFLVISYVIALLRKQTDVAVELESLNKNLEKIVAERTATLAERNSELAEANLNLQKLDELKSDFVSLVSHELRGPLTSLNGGLELALQDAENMPLKSRRVLEVMAHESERLTQFVQTILDVSKLSAGKLNLNCGPVAVLPLLKRATDVVLMSEGRKVEWSVPGSLPPVWADETYLEKIFCNLVMNAEKYSPGDKPIEIAAEIVDNRLQITVADHGPGIPEGMQHQIFERFQRVERGDQIKTKGWGLGLYFAKTLVEAQRGKLSVKSPCRGNGDAPGAAFMVTIPLADEVPEDG